jgi:hypothetical protein
MFLKTTLCAIACLAICLAVETVAQPVRPASPNQLTTPAEGAEFCARMRDAATPAERQAVAAKWREMMISRAAGRGVDMSPGMHNHQLMMGSDNGMHMGMDLNCSHTIAGAGDSNSSDAAALHVTQYRAIAYVTGGVGEVSDADGQLIFAAKSDGPYPYPQVPPGPYRLGATLNGVERSRSIDIPRRGGVDVFLTWAAAPPGFGG